MNFPAYIFAKSSRLMTALLTFHVDGLNIPKHEPKIQNQLDVINSRTVYYTLDTIDICCIVFTNIDCPTMC